MKRCTLEFHPIAIVEHEGPIEFYTPPDEDYLDMNSQSLKLHYVLWTVTEVIWTLTQKLGL